MSGASIDCRDWTLFLDRDGVINRRIIGGYITKPSELKLLPGAGEAIGIFSQIFSRIIVVTNQQGIGKGVMSQHDLAQVHHEMTSQLDKYQARIDAIYFCPFLSRDNPTCRKPNTGMADQALDQFQDINFVKSLMIGDSPSDIQFGKRKGMMTILIRHEYEEVLLPDQLKPDFEADGLFSIANNILSGHIKLK